MHGGRVVSCFSFSFLGCILVRVRWFRFPIVCNGMLHFRFAFHGTWSSGVDFIEMPYNDAFARYASFHELD